MREAGTLYWVAQLIICLVALPVFLLMGEWLLAGVAGAGSIGSVWVLRD